MPALDDEHSLDLASDAHVFLPKIRTEKRSTRIRTRPLEKLLTHSYATSENRFCCGTDSSGIAPENPISPCPTCVGSNAVSAHGGSAHSTYARTRSAKANV